MRSEVYILLAGVCGSAAGFFAGWKICDKRLRESYANMAASDISEVEGEIERLRTEYEARLAQEAEYYENGVEPVASVTAEDILDASEKGLEDFMAERLNVQTEHNADVNLASGASAALRGAAWGDVFLDGREDAFPYPQTDEWYTVDLGTEDYPHYVSGIKSRYKQSEIDSKMYPAPYIYDTEKYFAWIKEYGPDGLSILPDVAVYSLMWEEVYDVYLDEIDFSHPENSGDVIMTRNIDGEEEAVDKEEVECLLGTHAAAKFANYVKEHMLPTDAYFELCLINEGMARALILSVYMEGGSEFLEG